MANKALLVGINAYRVKPLLGCLNDIEDMATILTDKCGFAVSDVRMLADERATTAAILERLKWLMDGATAGDRLYFHYSGHGTQMATRDHQGEIDGLDEVICPIDFDFTDEHTIKDKDFKRIFAAVPDGVEFIWVSDSCHSGDLSRVLVPDEAITKEYPLPIDIQWRNFAAASIGLRSITMNAAATQLSNNVALIAGCRSDQTSADSIFEGRPNGALTYFLKKSIVDQGGMELPLEKLLDVVKSKIAATGRYRQVPGVEGSAAIIARPFMAI